MVWQQLEYDFLWGNVPQLLSEDKDVQVVWTMFPQDQQPPLPPPPSPRPPNSTSSYKLEPSNLASEFALGGGGSFHSGINRSVQRRVFMQTRLADGAEAHGGTARLSLGGGFENGLSCEYQTLYCLDSSDLIYQNEVIQPAREDKPSFQRINQAHQGPCLPLICRQ